MKWIEVLPVALMRIRIAPRIKEGVNPFEILYRKSYLINSLTTEENQIHIKGEEMLRKYFICHKNYPLYIDM